MTLQVACSTDALEPAEAMKVELTDANGATVPVAIVRDSDGTWHALGDTCTHADFSLADGDVEDGAIECWKHGSPFELATGRPLSLPATKPVPVYTIQISGSDVLVDVDATL
ncbi:non-heme iron oxygenase ferredoxin subunit [Arcanobacterium haemolyticum]|nr:non-heme iron oxygenase ferredoxin subunit [Arcanobacterium haemolyticum]